MSALTKPGEWTFGIQLPIQTLTRTLVDEWEDAATVDDLVAITKAADQHGYDFVGVCDHVAIPDNDYASKMTTTWYDTISTLSYLAAHTQHTHLLSLSAMCRSVCYVGKATFVNVSGPDCLHGMLYHH